MRGSTTIQCGNAVVEEGAVSSACLVAWLIEECFIQHSLLDDPGHSALAVLPT